MRFAMKHHSSDISGEMEVEVKKLNRMAEAQVSDTTEDDKNCQSIQPKTKNNKP